MKVCKKLNAAIIVAGGSGKRLQSDIPKQFLNIGGMPILMHTILKFYSFDNCIELIVVLSENYVTFWADLCKKYEFTVPHKVVIGGRERFFSVKNGLAVISGQVRFVAIHDAVRPFVSHSTICRGFELAQKKRAAVPVVPVTNSLISLYNNDNKYLDREQIRIVQTPQVFDIEVVVAAYRAKFSKFFTDDASVVTNSGVKIFLFDGNVENIKITTKFDLKFAELILSNISTN